jgi:flagellar motor switch protein FliM
MTDSNEPLLSQDEMSALLSAMKSGGGEASAEAVDFTSQDRRLRQATSRAEKALQETLTETRKFLRRMLNTQLTVQANAPDVVPFSTMSGQLLPGSAVAELRTRSGGEAILVVGPGLVSYVLHRRLGADVENMDVLPARPELSAMDRRVLRTFVTQFASLFSMPWCGDPEAFSIHQIVSRQVDLSTTANDESYLRLSLSLAVPKIEPEEAYFALTAGALRDIAVPESSLGQSNDVNPVDRLRMLARLGVAEIDAVAILGRTHASVRKIIDLKVGDVLRLDQVPDEPLTVTIAGVPKLRGMPVDRHGNMAVKITDLVKPEGS